MNTEWQNYINQLVKSGLYTKVAAIGTDGTILGISSGFSMTPEDINKLMEIGAPPASVVSAEPQNSYSNDLMNSFKDAMDLNEFAYTTNDGNKTNQTTAEARKVYAKHETSEAGTSIAATAVSTPDKPSTPVATIYGIVGSQLAIKEARNKIQSTFP